MIVRPQDYLVRIRPRAETFYVSQGRAVLATDRDGFISGGADHGLFVHETRLLSRYRYLIDGGPPRAVALSNVEQHTWLGYYIALPPGVEGGRDTGSGQMEVISEQTVELRLSRYVGDGLHEDVDLTNFTQKKVTFALTLDVDADFADVDETKWGREQSGEIAREWRASADGTRELCFDYRVERVYDNQEGRGIESLKRGLILRVGKTTPPPSYEDRRITFEVTLDPLDRWHACLNLTPVIDGGHLAPLYGCRSFAGTHNERDRRRRMFLNEATRFSAPRGRTLTHVVTGTLEQATRNRRHSPSRPTAATTCGSRCPATGARTGSSTAARATPARCSGRRRIVTGWPRPARGWPASHSGCS